MNDTNAVKYKLLVCAVLTAALGLGVNAQSFGTPFSVSGRITSSFPTQDGSTASIANDFTISVVGCDAKIRATGVSDLAIEYIEFGCSGQESFNLIKYAGEEPAANVSNIANLELFPSPAPESPAGLVIPIWLAYASKCYYSSLSNNLVFPVSLASPTFRQEELKLPAEWRFSSLNPQIVEEMTEFADGNVYRVENGKIVAQAVPPEFQGRQTNCVFRILSWTNIAGLNLPREFALHVFVPDVKMKAMNPLFTMTGVGMEFRAMPSLTAPEVAVAAPPNTRVTDKRFYSDGKRLRPILYHSKDGKIKSRKEMMTSVGYRDALMNQKTASPKITSRSLVLVSLIAVAGALPVFVFLLKRTRNVKGSVLDIDM